MPWYQTFGLLVIVALTWESVNAMYPVEIQRKPQPQGAWQSIATVPGNTYQDHIGRGRWCWRVRHTWPQRTAWSEPWCIRVR